MRKFAQKTDGVGEQKALVVGQRQAPGGRIERREKFVLGDHVRAGQEIEQRRFAGIGVTNHGRHRPLMALAALALHRTNFPHPFEFALQPPDPFLHPPPIDFQLRFARTARADAAALPREVAPHPRQARQQILQLRELDLQTAFTTPRALRENIENELGAVEHLAGKKIFQVASLRRREFIIENHRGDLLVLERFPDQLGLAFADVIRRRRLLQFLGHRVYYVGAGGIRQLGELLHRIAQIPFRDAVLLEADQDRAFLNFLGTNLNHPWAKTRAAFCAINSMASGKPCDDKFSGSKLVCRWNQVNCLLA